MCTDTEKKWLPIHLRPKNKKPFPGLSNLNLIRFDDITAGLRQAIGWIK